MTESQANKIKELIEKYNDVLMVSMRLAIAEDLVNLIVLNKDDKEFELSELLKNKEELSNFITKEFLKLNSSSVARDLSKMEEKKIHLQKQRKIKLSS